MQQSEIIVSPHATAFVGPDAVKLVRAAHLSLALKLYVKCKMIPTRGVTPASMLRMATEFSGKTYKRGAYLQAAEDVRIWVDTMKAALPVTHKE